MKHNRFYDEAKLMLEMLSFVSEEKCFALKGGTAINFFVREMPRLSVDIDLTYLPVQDRDTSLKGISDALIRIAKKITGAGFKIQKGIQNGLTTKLYASSGKIQITIEPNLVIRGTILKAKDLDLSTAVEKQFGISVSMKILSTSELYAGKICAALDRQNPRDFFDLKILFENEGITDEMRQCFVLYLAGHDRPMSELLEPTKKDISEMFRTHFDGMTIEPVSLEELIQTREKLIITLKKDLTKSEREFLISIKVGEPRWDLLPFKGIETLPAIQWKLINIKKIEKKKHLTALNRLKKVLQID